MLLSIGTLSDLINIKTHIPWILDLIKYLFNLLDKNPVAYFAITFGIPVCIMTVIITIYMIVKVKNNRPLGIIPRENPTAKEDEPPIS